MNEIGYLYVPANCENNSNSGAKCRLHVAFHGCEQYVDKIHGLFFRDAGYDDWADAHHVIILYPQATPWLRLADPSQITGNPKGCWDWWGYSGDEYLGRDGEANARCTRDDRANAPLTHGHAGLRRALVPDAARVFWPDDRGGTCRSRRRGHPVRAPPVGLRSSEKRSSTAG